MSTKEIRIANLRRWLANNATPQKEKSYFSQLLSGEAPFGERAARRLEMQYKMGDGFLDAPINHDTQRTQKSTEQFLNYYVTIEEAQILSAFRDTTEDGRDVIRSAASVANKLSLGSSRNQSNGR